MKKFFLLLLVLFPFLVQAQIITPFAGGGSSLGDGGPATAAKVVAPIGAIFDEQGNYYVACFDRVRMIAPSNIISTIVGTGSLGFGGDGGLATAALVNNATDVAVDTAGNLYIADGGNNRIRRVEKKNRCHHYDCRDRNSRFFWRWVSCHKC